MIAAPALSLCVCVWGGGGGCNNQGTLLEGRYNKDYSSVGSIGGLRKLQQRSTAVEIADSLRTLCNGPVQDTGNGVRHEPTADTQLRLDRADW